MYGIKISLHLTCRVFTFGRELELLKLKFTTDAKPKNKSSTTGHQPC